MFTVPAFKDIIKNFGTWTGSGTATAIIDYEFVDFVDLLFSGTNALVPGTDYTAWSGSTYIQFTEAYLSTLANGTYWYIAEFYNSTDGTYLSDRISLIINDPSRNPAIAGSGSPATGDDPYTLFLTTWLAIISALCLLMLFFYYRMAYGRK